MAIIITKALTGGQADLEIEIPDLGSDPADDITGGNTSTLYECVVDCTANTGEDVAIRFYDSDAPTVGSDDAVLVLPGIKGRKLTYICKKGQIIGSTGTSVAAVQEIGGTGGATSPTGTVKTNMKMKA